MDSPESRLHSLIGQRERARKKWESGDPDAEAYYNMHKNNVNELLRKHPELESKVQTFENHFFKKLYW